jgi:hypothetical protein
MLCAGSLSLVVALLLWSRECAAALGVGAGREVLGSAPRALRYSSVPLFGLDPLMQAHVSARGLSTSTDVRDWYARSKELVGLLRVGGRTFRFLGACNECPGGAADGCECPVAMVERSVTVGSCRTELVSETPDGSARVTVNFVQTVAAENATLQTRPAALALVSVELLHGSVGGVDGGSSTSTVSPRAQVYLDFSAEFCSDADSKAVRWDAFSEGPLRGVRLGTVEQKVLSHSGDKAGIDWGFLYVGSADGGATAGAGASFALRTEFARSGLLSGPGASSAWPRPAVRSRADKAVAAVVRDLGELSAGRAVGLSVAFGYDDVASVLYYGRPLRAAWTRAYRSVPAALAEAAAQPGPALERARRHEALIADAMELAGGPGYAALGLLAYRTTLAALKPVWDERDARALCFLKEISTNGDMNTVDVIYPASPMLLAFAPELLAALLLPIMALANNETTRRYARPFAPHELGTYPVADHGSEEQEPMPMENSGNMLLMLLGVLQRQPHAAGTAWFYPHYWPLLRTWADDLVATLPFPEEQLCTDDFNGRLANNTNLAAKAIVALRAFADICVRVGEQGCDVYAARAKGFADTWLALAQETGPGKWGRHTKLAFAKSASYSIKYNIVWQQLLRLDGPFPAQLLRDEVAFYKQVANRYGVPLDSRNANTKLDWLAFAATMADDRADFVQIMAPIYDMVDQQHMVQPVCDLYDTTTAENPYFDGFRNRPVLGGIFARMLRPDGAEGGDPAQRLAQQLTQLSTAAIEVHDDGVQEIM